MTKLRLIPAAAALAGMTIGLAWGYTSYRYRLPPFQTAKSLIAEVDRLLRAEERVGRGLTRRRDADADPDPMGRLATLGYLSAVQPAEASGVVTHDLERTWDAPRLLSLGHAPEARLVAPDGRVLHRWTKSLGESFPDLAPVETQLGERYWRKVLLVDDGDLFAIHDYIGMVRLDVDSRLEWAKLDRFHHDVIPSGRGTFFAVAARREVVEWLEPEREIEHDFLVEIDPEGRELQRISILEAFRDSPYAPLLNAVHNREDPTHTNSLQLLDGAHAERTPAFREGALLLSSRTMSAVFVIHPEDGRVRWAATGMFAYQHAPKLLASGSILLFDNYGDSTWRENGGERRYRSRALELDPLTQQVVWNHDSRFGELFSACCGAAQRLPNGNTLITETDNGRVLEVTPDHRVVWDYYTPDLVGDYVARLIDAVALEAPPAWLDEPEGAASGDRYGVEPSSSGNGSSPSISSNEIVASAENLR